MAAQAKLDCVANDEVAESGEVRTVFAVLGTCPTDELRASLAPRLQGLGQPAKGEARI